MFVVVRVECSFCRALLKATDECSLADVYVLDGLRRHGGEVLRVPCAGLSSTVVQVDLCGFVALHGGYHARFRCCLVGSHWLGETE